jgi:hypothetical protein
VTSEHVFTTADLMAAIDATRVGGRHDEPPAVSVRCCGWHAPVDRLHGPRCPFTAAFGLHLQAVRHASGGPAPGELQCCRRPAIDPAMYPRRTALPHLLAVRHNGYLNDRIVWEVLDRQTLRTWLPTADDPDRWSDHIHLLRRLRVRLRYRDPATDHALVELRDRLSGHYLSIKFVLEHPREVAHALTELDAHHRPQTTEQDTYL